MMQMLCSQSDERAWNLEPAGPSSQVLDEMEALFRLAKALGLPTDSVRAIDEALGNYFALLTSRAKQCGVAPIHGESVLAFVARIDAAESSKEHAEAR